MRDKPPLRGVIDKTDYGHQVEQSSATFFFLYTDGIKLCAKSERDIDSLIHTTRICSNDIEMD